MRRILRGNSWSFIQVDLPKCIHFSSASRKKDKLLLHITMFSSIITILSALLSCFVIQVVAVQSQVCYTFVDPCPASWHHWGNSCYMVTDSSFPWSSARDECIKFGGILAVPRSLEENDFIATLIPDGKNAWIDCNDLETEGIWECREANMEVTYRNWGNGQPNNRYDQEHCAYISRYWGSRRQWYDEHCDTNHLAVCKQGTRPLIHI